ncbi:MAG: hypothetical protein WC783_01835 [Candidatus Paceibacterota bacterium]
MAHKRLLIHIIILMFLIVLLDKGANKFYWQNSVWYFDIIMHFLGGVWVGFFFIYVYSPLQRVTRPVLKVLLSVFLIGISWEIFEFVVNNVIGRIPFDAGDTLSDIFWDLTGGLIATFYFFKFIMPSSENKIQ